MVEFRLDSKNDHEAVYDYFPEGKDDGKAGKIRLTFADSKVELVKPSGRDFLCRTTAAELNKLRDDINELRREAGELPLTEEELPSATEDEVWYSYADHVMSRIRDEFGNGILPDNGTVVWY